MDAPLAGVYKYLTEAANNSKRRLKGLLADPEFALEQTVNDNLQAYTLPVLQQMAGVKPKDNPLTWGKPKVGPEDYLGAGVIPGGMVAMTAWHGSPHKFDKFSMDKIGTGEGAQAYGHGLYLAEAPEVANTYKRTQINNAPELEQMALRAGASPEAANTIAQWYHSTKGRGGIEAALDILREPHPVPHMQKYRTKLLAEEPAMRKAWEQFTDPGQLYKTDIPDEAVARFLDWDKPLSQQAPEVQAAVNKLGLSETQLRDLTWGGPASRPSQGMEIYSEGRQKFGEAGFSDALKREGIPGIRYLDGGSRSAGQGSSNFVIFDPEMIRILERNGQATGQQPWQPGEYGGLLK
jgi:hypothetical protein